MMSSAGNSLRNGAAERGEGVDFEIVDLMSTNACYVDGHKVQGSAHPLHDTLIGKPWKNQICAFASSFLTKIVKIVSCIFSRGS